LIWCALPSSMPWRNRGVQLPRPGYCSVQPIILFCPIHDMPPQAYVATIGTNMDSSIVVRILVWPVHLMAGPLNEEEVGVLLLHLRFYGWFHEPFFQRERGRSIHATATSKDVRDQHPEVLRRTQWWAIPPIDVESRVVDPAVCLSDGGVSTPLENQSVLTICYHMTLSDWFAPFGFLKFEKNIRIQKKI
jgi:hypothetical protein